MDPQRQLAYLKLLAAALYRQKNELGSWLGGPLLGWGRRARAARRSALRAYAFHNLCLFAVWDFRGFEEDRFWKDIELFYRDCPEARADDYRAIFEALLRGDEVDLSRPRVLG